jgi:hypothetical protein
MKGVGAGKSKAGTSVVRGATFPPRTSPPKIDGKILSDVPQKSMGIASTTANALEGGVGKRKTPRVEASSVATPSSSPAADSAPNTPRQTLADSKSVAARRAELEANATDLRREKFEKLLYLGASRERDNVDAGVLKKEAWNGCPPECRAMVWQMLLGYLPYNSRRRAMTLARKRKEYRGFVEKFYDAPKEGRTKEEQKILRQILVDVPRTRPEVPLFHQPAVRRLLERVLYIWALRHPASGYVQGINDLATPFVVVFLSKHLSEIEAQSQQRGDGDEVASSQPMGIPKNFTGESGGLIRSALSCDVGSVGEERLGQVEADTFWCLTKLLDGIQDHYTFAQPGLQRMVYRLKELMGRVDPALDAHLEKCGVDYMSFAFRWMNCLLLRELALPRIVRLWDACLSEDDGFGSFHVYVCAAFLKCWSDRLQAQEFQEIVTFLQDVPTNEWGNRDVEELLSQSFILKTLYDGAQNHLRQ